MYKGSSRVRKPWESVLWLKAQVLSHKRGKKRLFLVSVRNESGNDGGEVGIISWVCKLGETKTYGQGTEGGREKNGFLRVICADELLTKLRLSLEEAVELRKFTEKYSEPLLFLMVRAIEGMSMALMEDENKAFKRTDIFKSVSLEIATSSAKGNREFRFLEEGENGSTSRGRYA